MNVTLKDFRGVLGRVNDGNVLLGDGGGVRKVNHGNVLTRMLFHYETAPNDAGANKRVRMALFNAIERSREGGALSASVLNSIRRALGIDNGMVRLDGREVAVIDTPLSRRVLKAILSQVDSNVDSQAMIDRECRDLKARYAWNFGVAKWAREALDADDSPFRDAAAMKNLLPKNVPEVYGFPCAEVERFFTDNAQTIRAFAFDRLYWRGFESTGIEGDVTKNPPMLELNKLLVEVTRFMMTSFADHKDPKTHTDAIPLYPVRRGEQIPMEVPEELGKMPRFTGLLKNLDGLARVLSTPPRTWEEVKRTNLMDSLLTGQTLRRMVQQALVEAYNVSNEQGIKRCEAAFNVLRKDHFPLLDNVDLDDVEDLGEAFRAKLVEKLESMPNILEENSASVRAKATLNAALELLVPLKTETLVGEIVRSVMSDANIPDEHFDSIRNNVLQTICGGDPGNGVSDDYKQPLDNLKCTMLKTGQLSGASDLGVFRGVVEEVTNELGLANEERKNLLTKIGNSTLGSYLTLGLKKDPVTKKPDPLENGKLLTLEILLGRAGFARVAPLQGSGVNQTFDPTEENMQKVDAALNRCSLAQLKMVLKYIEYATFSEGLLLEQGKPRPFFNAVCDKVLDLSKMSRQAFVNFSELMAGGSKFAWHVPKTCFDEPTERLDTRSEHYPELYQELRKAALAYCDGKIDSDDFKRSGFLAQELGNETKSIIPSSGFDGLEMLKMAGFGTSDVKTVVSLFRACGCPVEELDSTAGMIKGWIIQKLADLNGLHLDGLREWSERVSGKKFEAITVEDVGRLMALKAKNKLVDPIVFDGKNGVSKAACFIVGQDSLAKAGLPVKEVQDLYQALKALTTAPDSTVNVTLHGVAVQLQLNADGATITARIGDKKLPLRAMNTLPDLRERLENEIIDHIDAYGTDLVKDVLPSDDAEVARLPLSRVREMCSRVLAFRLKVPEVRFAQMPTTDLVRNARLALDGQYGVDDLKQVKPTAYNSAEAIELQGRVFGLRESQVKKVTLPPADPGRSMAERTQQPPDPKTVRNFVADLLMDKDTRAFDKSADLAPGARLRAVFESYRPELKFMLAPDGVKHLESLPEVVRERVTNLLEPLKGTDLDSDKAFNGIDFAKLEEDVRLLVKDAMTDMQKTVSDFFPATKTEGKDLWKKSFSEINGTGGLDEGTRTGRFIKDVLDHYFAEGDEIEQRAMLSAMVRNTAIGADDLKNEEAKKGLMARQVSELLKGAGPLLQKTLQGLPIETFPPETQMALKDMKSRLAPIPDESVRAQMLDLIANSHGEILSIEVKRTLGAATIGQAFLCHILTKDHPVTGEDVVIKLLRPNVSTAIQREYEVMSKYATDGMAATFENQYRSILQELDFTLEAGNIDQARIVYERPRLTVEKKDKVVEVVDLLNVRSMGRFTALSATRNALVLQKVEGTTLDGFVRDERKIVDEILKPYAHQRALGPNLPTRTVYEVDSPNEQKTVNSALRKELNRVVSRRRQVVEFVQAWLEGGLFGNGLIHGDPHAGNLMSDGELLTAIDFGNMLQLNPTEQRKLTVMIAAAFAGDGPQFCKKLEDLLTEDQKKAFSAQKEAILADLKVVLAKGTSSNVCERFLAALAVIQRHDCPLPGVVGAFVQSLARLKDVLTELDDLIDDIVAKARSITYAPDFLKKMDGTDELARKFPALKQVDEFLMCYAMRNVDPGAATKVGKGSEARKSFDKLLSVSGNTGYLSEKRGQFDGSPEKPVCIEILHNPAFMSQLFGQDGALLFDPNDLLAKYGRKGVVYGTNSHEDDFLKRKVAYDAALENIRQYPDWKKDVDTWDANPDDLLTSLGMAEFIGVKTRVGKAPKLSTSLPDDRKAYIAALGKYLYARGKFIGSMVNVIASYATIDDAPVAVEPQKSFEDIFVDGLQSHIFIDKILPYGKLGEYVKTEQALIFSAKSLAPAFLDKANDYDPAWEAGLAAADAQNQKQFDPVRGDARRRLRKAALDFCQPPTGIPGKVGNTSWCKNKKLRDELCEILHVNLSIARHALRDAKGDRTSLTSAELDYFAHLLCARICDVTNADGSAVATKGLQRVVQELDDNAFAELKTSVPADDLDVAAFLEAIRNLPRNP